MNFRLDHNIYELTVVVPLLRKFSEKKKKPIRQQELKHKLA